jgi:mannitol 2-dehydrogenase
MTTQSASEKLIALSEAALPNVPADVSVPTYDRSALTAGILHIGVGNFHRAHQAWYMHQLMQAGHAHDWAIIGAGVKPFDAAQRDKLRAQDHLTTLLELSPVGRRVEIIGPMIDYLPVEPDNHALIERMAQPDIRIVSLTVTEGGYYINPVTKAFDAAHPDISRDATHPDRPTTAFGAMVAALRLRRDNGIGPFTGLCCDNIQSNGEILRQTVVALARLSDPTLANWIAANCSFPNSMVDCIVPATGPKELELARTAGIDDAAPVSHENFRQWVIEDNFCAGRPDLDLAGATFSSNVHHYEAMKIRILNGGHQVIAGVGELLSLHTIADCMRNKAVAGLFSKVARQEIAPLVKPVSGMTPDAYTDLIAKRFSNPHIVDTTRRVAFDGSSRHPGFIVPSIRDGLAAGTPIDGLALVSAIWARMCEGTREDGTQIEPNDPHWDALQETAQNARRDPGAWLAQEQYYGDLATNPAFAQAFSGWLAWIYAKGVASALDSYLAG